MLNRANPLDNCKSICGRVWQCARGAKAKADTTSMASQGADFEQNVFIARFLADPRELNFRISDRHCSFPFTACGGSERPIIPRPQTRWNRSKADRAGKRGKRSIHG